MFCLGNNDGRDMLKKFWHDDGHDDDGKKLCVIAKALVTELKRATMLKILSSKAKESNFDRVDFHLSHRPSSRSQK